MAGAFSGHLVDSFNAYSSFNSPMVKHGAMSFNPTMHGTPFSPQSFSPFNSQSLLLNESVSEETAKKIATLQVKLDQKLGPEYISQRPGPGGGPKLTYVEGWKIINLANEVFGFNGWSSSVVSLTTDFADYSEETRRYNVGVTAIMRVTLRDGVYHEDIGYGMLENSKSKGAALDKCKKEAVTDGLKRALRNFGNVLGNCLYDKSYTSEIVKVKFEPPKFNKEDLHRRPEFEDIKPNISELACSKSAATPTSNLPKTAQIGQNYPARSPIHQADIKSITPLPQRGSVEVRPSITTSTSNVARINATHRASNVTVKSSAHPNLCEQPSARNVVSTSNDSAQRTLVPHQHHQTLERRVSFTENSGPQVVTPIASLPHKHEDDEYGFNSDDDALLAMADLGPPVAADEADIGRPIEHESDAGRPIDLEEGLMHPIEETHFGCGRLDASRQSASKCDDATKARQELIEAALRSGSNSNSTPVEGQRQGQASTPAASTATSLSSVTATSTKLGSFSSNAPTSIMGPPPLPPLHDSLLSSRMRPSNPQQQRTKCANQRQKNQDQNVAPQNGTGESISSSSSLSSTHPAEAGVMRVSAPSAGGFRFPPGINPFPSGVNMGQVVNTSSIGVKRSAEAMDPLSNTRGVRPGMGLQNATTSLAHNAKREVLGSLEVGEGGDVKRRRW